LMNIIIIWWRDSEISVIL